MKASSALVPLIAVYCPEERLQPNCLRSRHTRPTPGVMVWGAISYDSRSTLVVIRNTLTANLYVSLVIQPLVLPFMNSIQRGIFLQNNARPRISVVTQQALQNADILPWPVRFPDLSPVEQITSETVRSIIFCASFELKYKRHAETGNFYCIDNYSEP
ncbi:uncharacterized protein TNCV_1320011 [Trichonephila clavipes]|nr:uncharacterized protein TNCV_1320011 [Trichonephila clavipes]